MASGGLRRGKDFFKEALVLYRELGTSGLEVVRAHIGLAICELKLGYRERAVEIYERAAEMARAAGSERSVATILNNLGNIALDERDFTRARAHFEESLAINRRTGEMGAVANNLVDLGFAALAEPRVGEAAARFREGLSISRAERIADQLVWAVEGLAAVAVERAPAEATRLLAATVRTRTDLAFGGYYPIGDESRARTLDAARAQLGEEAFAAARLEGEALSLEAAAQRAAALVH